MTSLRRNRHFWLLWSGRTVSLAGSQVSAVAIPLVAVLTLNASAWEMGVLMALGRVPYLLVGLPAGVWVDRLPRRAVLLTGTVGQAVCPRPTLAVAAAGAAVSASWLAFTRISQIGDRAGR